MELVKDTEMEAAWLVWQARPPQPSLTVVVKATYALGAEGVAVLADAQALPTGDEHRDDDPERSLRYASDLDPLKPAGECLVIGSYRPLGEAPVTQSQVAFRVGPIDKRFVVFGDRAWKSGSPTAPARITEVPLAWERAFGGPGHGDNPVGRGLSAADDSGVVLLPNLEDPRRLVTSRDARPAPVGSGAIPRTWASRIRLAGTYDAAWLARRYPWYPEDLDWRYFMAAPRDQQIEGFWRGDEEITLENLHPEHARVRCRLPGHAAHAALVPAQGGALRPVGLRLDTLVVDADAGCAYAIWRGVIEVRDDALSDVSQLYVTHAPSAERLDAAALEARYRAKLEADAAAEADLHAAPIPLVPGKRPSTPEVAGSKKGAAAPPEKTVPEGVVVDPDAPGARWAHLDQAMTLQGNDGGIRKVLDAALAQHAKGEIPSVFDDALGIERGFSKERELGPEELLELEMMMALGDLLAPEEDGRRQEVREALARGESLSGWDLSGVDLSGVGLVDADLRGAILARTNLSGAHVERCRFDGANLTEAELSLASFDGCSFRGADMTSVRAHRSRWHDTSFEEATVRGSYFREARFMSCDLQRAELGDSDLSEADLRDCEMAEADLSACLLERARFSRCRLVDAWLEGGVKARGAVFDGCDADLLRASEGADLEGASFKKTRLAGARFGGARLRGATFNLARLSRADFAEAFLHEAQLMGCDLVAARFDGASLVGASLLKSNLMEAKLEGTNLSGADLRGANLFRAELLGARLDGARLDLANLEGTRRKEPA